MAEPVTDIKTCANCGADVRPDTQFCYSCGKSIVAASAADESLAGLERALAASRTNVEPTSKREAAAAERRKARLGQRRPIEVVWESAPPSPLYFIVAAVIFILVVIVVFLTRTGK